MGCHGGSSTDKYKLQMPKFHHLGREQIKTSRMSSVFAVPYLNHLIPPYVLS